MFVIQLYDLPMEMLDVILQKSHLHWTINSSAKQRDEDVIRSLISVDVCFNRRITRQRFKKATWRHLKSKIYSKYNAHTFFIRSQAFNYIKKILQCSTAADVQTMRYN